MKRIYWIVWFKNKITDKRIPIAQIYYVQINFKHEYVKIVFIQHPVIESI